MTTIGMKKSYVKVCHRILENESRSADQQPVTSSFLTMKMQ